MTLSDILAAAISEYDGRSPGILTEVAHRHRDDPGYVDALVDLSAHAERLICEGATWLLKKALEEGAEPTREQIAALVEALPAIKAWQAQLHLCQSIAMLEVPPACRLRLAAWLRDRIGANRPFLRAWALDALYRIEGPTDQMRSLLDRMATDEAASVRARVRGLRRNHR